MTIAGRNVREWIEKVAPWAICGLIVWGLKLYANQFVAASERNETDRRIGEIERQQIRIWETIDRAKKEKEIAEIQEWRRIMEPMIKKGAGLE